jgi:hypothetical protein
LLPAASAVTAKDIASAAARVEIRSFFMVVSPTIPGEKTPGDKFPFRLFS